MTVMSTTLFAKIDDVIRKLEAIKAESERRRAYDKHAAMLDPVRKELDRINGKIAAIMSTMPPIPIS